MLLVLLLAGATFALAQTLVLPALPELIRDLDTSRTTGTWIVTGFLLSASVATPIVGKLGDVHGKGRVLVVVMVLFSLGAVVNALAPSAEVLIAGRVLQGVAGGVLPLAFGIMRDTLPAARLPSSLGLMSAILGIGAGIGLPLSGVIADHLDLAWLFWINLLSLPAAVAAHRLIPPSPRVPSVQIDWLGAAVLSVAVGALLLAVTQAGVWGWGSAATAGLLAAGVALSLVWVVVEARTAEPFMDLTVLRAPTVAAANLNSFLVGLALFSAFVLVPQFGQAPTAAGYGFGASTAGGALLIVPAAVTQLLVGPFTGRLGMRLGFRRVLTMGAATIAVSFAFMAVAHARPVELLVATGLMGVGIALAFGAVTNLIVAATPQRDVGVATGINTVMRTFGAAFGVAVTTAILSGTEQGGLPAEGGYTAAFLFSAGAAVLSLGAALLVPRVPSSVAPATPARAV